MQPAAVFLTGDFIPYPNKAWEVSCKANRLGARLECKALRASGVSISKIFMFYVLLPEYFLISISFKYVCKISLSY
jgi:hypothetical protein